MPSTFSNLYLHLVFSTKNRARVIHAEWKERLHAFLGGCFNSRSVIPIEIGGVDDHVHALVRTRPTHKISDLLREIKGGSSAWVHETIGERAFEWQEGYGAFSVSHSGVARVREYIRNQESHHQKKSFDDEYRELLRRHGIEFREDDLGR